MKLVSVIIPTHKGSIYICSAVESVLNQTYKNIEIIVVDDNGKDTEEQLKTEQVLTKYILNNKIKYIVHQTNINGSAARNTGFRNSSGDFICLLDDDDEYYPNKVEKEVEALNSLGNEYGMVFCGCEGSDKGKSGDILFDVLIHSVVIGSNSFMIRRDIWEKLNGFDESFKRHQDYEFTARVANITKIKYLKFIGFKTKETKRNNPKNKEQDQLYREHYLNKMQGLIRNFSLRERKFIICCNCMEVTSKGNIFKNHELLDYAKKWEPSFGYCTIWLVIIFKICRKIKWMIKKNKRGILNEKK